MTYSSLLLFLLYSALLLQQPPKFVMVNAKPGCPVELSGTVRFLEARTGSQYPFTANLSATNVSRRDIVLLMTRVEVSAMTQEEKNDQLTGANAPERSELRVDEFYFRDSLFEPGSTLTFEIDFPPLNDAPSPDSQTLARTTTGEVIYVQFVDGTFWGDPRAAAAPLMQRKQSVERLQQFVDVYRKYGELGLAGELNQTSQLPVVNSLQKLHGSDEATLPVVIARIESMLQAAKLHRADMATTPDRPPDKR